MFVIAGYIIANRPIGTPSEIRFGTLASKVPAAIALIDSMGGVRAKSETESRFPMAMPIAMLNSTKKGRRRKSSSFVSRRAVIGQAAAWTAVGRVLGNVSSPDEHHTNA